MPADDSRTTELADLHNARQRLQGVGVNTPLLESPLLNEAVGKRVLIKAECLQVTGSFKFRGAWSAISALPESTRRKGILAYSSGNHAQAIAYAAALHNVPATIVMPNDAPQSKLANTRDYGADVVLYDRPGGESRESIGAALAESRGYTLIKPYDNSDVIAGQGTCGLEICEQLKARNIDHAEILVCCGGGGLTAGIALATEAHPGLTVRPVEPADYNDVQRSLLSGTRESNNHSTHSICDAIVTPAPGVLTFPIMHRLCGSALSVSDANVLVAMAIAYQRLKLVIEPGGAVALAAALFNNGAIESDTVVCTASGGNVDATLFTQALNTTLPHSFRF